MDPLIMALVVVEVVAGLPFVEAKSVAVLQSCGQVEAGASPEAMAALEAAPKGDPAIFVQ